MTTAPDKAADAFRTIGEVSRDTGIPQHILRYWETRFPQLKPLQRAGNRRYYRPDDIVLVLRIQRLLEAEGYTIRGVQKLLEGEVPAQPRGGSGSGSGSGGGGGGGRTQALRRIRDALVAALDADR